MSLNRSGESVLTLPLTEGFKFTFVSKGVSFDCKVTELSRNGLKVQCPQAGTDEISNGMHVENAVLDHHQVGHHDSLSFFVTDITTAQGEGFLMQLTSADEKTSSNLWLASRLTQTDIQSSVVRKKLEGHEIPRIPARGIYTEQARLERLEFLRKETGAALESQQVSRFKPDELTGNIENLFGSVEIPVGLVGPLMIRGSNFCDMVYAPFATTEGALVASAARGATAMTRAGGVTTRILAQRMLRVPLFELSDMNGAVMFVSWIRDHTEAIKATVTEVSRHAHLTALETTMVGNMVHVSFIFETGDAAGQNMTTACTWHACQWIMRQMKHFDMIKFENFVIDGNMSGDKKVNFASFLMGRGTRVAAECFIDRKILNEVLKVSPEQFCRIHQTNLVGGIQTGMIGYNVNIANVIGAMFAATGQDIASVHECSIGNFHAQAVEDGIYVSLLLPSLIVGTVGGGTHLTQQNEMLQMMGCVGLGKAGRLAEIIAGFCLSLEISTGAAIASGQFVTAHERLGRNRPVSFFSKKDLTADFFSSILRGRWGTSELSIESFQSLTADAQGSSIISELTARKVQKLVGLLPYRVCYRVGQAPPQLVDLMIKIKPLAAEIELLLSGLASQCGGSLAETFPSFKERTGTAMCHERELAIADLADPAFRDVMPVTYKTHRDPKRETYLIAMELLADMDLMNTSGDPSGWTRRHIEVALSAAARFHAVYYDNLAGLLKSGWIGTVQNAHSMTEMMPLWYEMSNHMFEEFAEWFDKDDRQIHRSLISSVADWWLEIEKMPRTLIHNDFSPRNLCFRKSPEGPKLVAYDWELATIHIPQHDLAELLAFTMNTETTPETVQYFVEYHRTALEKATGRSIDAGLWRRGYRLALWDLGINRLALYMMAHTFRHYDFMFRVVKTTQRLMFIEKEYGQT